MIEITSKLIEQSKGKEGFTEPQARMANRTLGKKWINKLRGRLVTESWWKSFCNLGKLGNPLKEKKVTVKNKSKKGKNRGKNKKHKFKVTYRDSFYSSKEWRELRVRVIEKYESKCMMCGRSPKIHGIVIHVDHIKSRSKYPLLALEFNNLQLLCEDCNLGKSNKYETDWRPKMDIDETEELDIVFEAAKYI